MEKIIDGEEEDAKEIFGLVREHSGTGLLHLLFRKIAPINIVINIIQMFPHLVCEVDSDGISPLHTAAACGLPPIFTSTLLSTCPESALMRDKYGRTPLIAACQSQSSGLDVDSSYTVPGLEYTVDFWIHHQIVLGLLQVPLNGVADVDCCGLNALDYTIQSNGPLSVVQLLQAQLAIEHQIILELNNTTKRTRLPKLPPEPYQQVMISSPWSLPSLRKSCDDDSFEDEGPYEEGWRPIMFTARDSEHHGKKRLDIYDRMKKLRLGCDSSGDTNMHYKRGLKSFIGAKDCDDSTLDDDFISVVYNPFDLDIPLVIDVLIGPDDADEQLSFK